MLTGDDAENYQMWLKAKKRFMGDGTDNAVDLSLLKSVLPVSVKSDSVLQNAMGKKEYTGNELDTFQATTPETRRARAVMMFSFRENQIMDSYKQSFFR